MSAKDFNGDPPSIFVHAESDSRYLKAKKGWLDRVGGALQHARSWRYFACFCLFIIFVQGIGMIYLSTKSSFIPFVIEVDSSTGMARPIGPAKEGNYVASEAAIKYFISQWVLKTRTIPLDPVLYRKNREGAYALMRKNAGLKLEQVLRNENRDDMFGKQTVLPNIISVLPSTQNTFQVRWTEEVFDIAGGRKVVVPMTGLFTIETEQPRDENQFFENPLGIYISDFTWSKDQK